MRKTEEEEEKAPNILKSELWHRRERHLLQNNDNSQSLHVEGKN